ncbi:hypothetical protein LDENG_00006730 [Lucifuga dentata]|nr:hypothetical protein LDENG_00006730 [Lucifuga dentata]
MASFFLIFILLGTCGGVSGQFQLEPVNATVLQGSDAQINATVQGKWEVMTWYVGRLLVLTVNNSTGSISTSSEKFSANNNNKGESVEFTIHNVSRSDAGPVVCSILGHYGSKEALLIVQESGTVNIIGGNQTVVKDQQVEFQCVTTAWYPTAEVSWSRNGQAVNDSLYNTSSVAYGDWYNSTSVLNFQAVSNTTVECLANLPTLIHPQSSSVYLVVVPKPPDWTVLIAVVVSFGSFALLVLLIIGIIFYYKRRKEKESRIYQDELNKRVRTQSQISGAGAAGQRQGQINLAYVTEGQTTPSVITDSGFSQERSSHISETPEVVHSNQAGNEHNSAYKHDTGVRKHRHVTIV